MLDGVGQVGVVALDARLREREVEQPARRADERLALDVLAVPGLLADEQHPGSRGPGPEDRLSGRLVEVAAPAVPRRVAQRAQTAPGGHERFGRRLRDLHFRLHNVLRASRR
ncbi:hypothetical protein N599_07455 [Saccharopolyspora erythraea D]|nr:hypothetical protein N599_07455 [Saccharopolyspora erythraea D]